MKNKTLLNRVTAGIISLIIIFAANDVTVTADNKEQQSLEKVDDMVQEVMKKAKIPDISIAVIQGEEIQFLSYGSNAVNEDSLFQIGSITKAFTALGILLLEEEGKLSINDPVSKYIPWYEVKYESKAVDPEQLTIANLIYQTSGFTNDELKYPSAVPGITLEENVRNICGNELTFYPSDQYAYSNVNYNTLGLLIEIVSGQSYEAFMTEHILHPLGLDHTYVNAKEALETDNIVKGSRLSFLRTKDYELPIAEGTIPAGYMISSTADLGRWLQIQMGQIEVSDQFRRIIEKSHIADRENEVGDGSHYAGGWFVDAQGNIYHSGGTANYSGKVSMRSDQNNAVVVLTNMNASANTNDIADNILNIIEGKPSTVYQADIWYIFDTIFTVLTFGGSLLILFFVICLFRDFRQVKSARRIKTKMDKRKIVLIVIPVLFVLLSIVFIVMIPIIFGSSWGNLSVWAPASIFWGTGIFTVMSILFLMHSIVVSKYRNEDTLEI